MGEFNRRHLHSYYGDQYSILRHTHMSYICIHADVQNTPSNCVLYYVSELSSRAKFAQNPSPGGEGTAHF